MLVRPPPLPRLLQSGKASQEKEKILSMIRKKDNKRESTLDGPFLAQPCGRHEMAASPKRWSAAAHQGIDPWPHQATHTLFTTLMLHQKHKHVVDSDCYACPLLTGSGAASLRLDNLLEPSSEAQMEP